VEEIAGSVTNIVRVVNHSSAQPESPGAA